MVVKRVFSNSMWGGIALVVIAGLVLAALESYQVFWNTPRLKRDRQLVSHTFEVIATANGLELALRDAERWQRNYLITGEPSELAPHRAGMQEAPRLFGKLNQLTSDNPEQQARMPQLERLIDDKLAELKRTSDLNEAKGRDGAMAAIRAGLGSDPMNAVRAAIGEVVATEEKLLREREARAAANERRAAQTAVAAALLAFAAITAGALLMLRAFYGTRRSEHTLRESEEQLRILVSGVTDYAIYMLDPKGRITTWNAGARRIKGYEADEIIGQHFSRFYTAEDQQAHMPRQVLETAAREGRYEAEAWRVRKDGSQFWASVVVDALRDGTGRLLGFAKVTRDVTERHEREQELGRVREMLAQSQKMEALGQLTGGIAHDINNVLTVIRNAVDALERRVRAGERDVSRYADAISRGTERAAALTQRLLAFARRQALDPKPLDANKLVAGLMDMLRRTLPEGITVETALAGGLWWTQVDPSQLESAVLNLVLNARDAMPAGGKLTIETANAFLDETYAAAHTEVSPGQYVMIAVSDTGAGMTKEVASKAFEPFFTTKDVGQGTGLGLSQVYGFIKQSRGHVKIYSELGEGATVKIYLPRLEAPQLSEPAVEIASPTGEKTGQTILLVEDDLEVREFISESLGEMGYRVFAAADGHSALTVLDAHGDIDLLFTDVGLPNGMNGRELAEAARSRRPKLRVLFTTGYARNAIIHHGRLDAGVNLISKPYTQTELAAKLRSVLEG